MNPYTVSCVHTGNIRMYHRALTGTDAAANADMLTRLVQMEVSLVAEADDLISALADLQRERRKLGRRRASQRKLRIV